MNFQSFAEAHGLIIKSLVMHRWVRCSTVDHPSKKNGAYIFTGDSGAIQNWAAHEKAIAWRPDEEVVVDTAKIEADKKRAREEAKAKRIAAEKKAGYIMHNVKKDHHPYLVAKGFPEEKGWVYEGSLVIPMRTEYGLCGCQMISAGGQKRFLSGQRTKGAAAVFDNKGRTILCEGYATALSIRRALKAVRTRYKIVVCFSAGNLKQIASCHPDCFIVADHDESGTGQRVAKETGRPYWLAPCVGYDFNDFELEVGAKSAGEHLVNEMLRWEGLL